MNRYHILMLLCCATIGLARAQEQLNLKQVIELTMANNPQIKQFEASRVASTASVEKVKANYYPQLAAHANYACIDPTGFVQFGSSELSFIPNDNYNLNLELQMNIYDFGRTNTGLKIAKNGEQLAENNLILTKQELAFATIQTYYQIHFLQEAIKVQERHIEALNETLSQTKKMQENGEGCLYFAWCVFLCMYSFDPPD